MYFARSLIIEFISSKPFGGIVYYLTNCIIATIFQLNLKQYSYDCIVKQNLCSSPGTRPSHREEGSGEVA